MPRAAMARSPAVRATALLTPDAMPARFCETEFITVVVRGATLMAIPRPRITTGGKKMCPVTAAHISKHEQRETTRGDQRTDNQRKFCSITDDEPARPTRKKGN